MSDLKDGFIRTPLPPKETFKDDPLRVLRCIRFASRLGYTLVQELTEAALDPVIQVRGSCCSVAQELTILTIEGSPRLEGGSRTSGCGS